MVVRARHCDPAPAVHDASGGAGVAFREIGPVELKGMTGAMPLHAATLPG